MSNTLYELTAAYADLIEAVQETENGEEIADLLAQLDDVDKDWHAKAESYAKLLRETEARADAAKNEADRLTARRKKLNTLAEGLKARMKASMQLMGLTKAETAIGTWKIGKGRESVQVIDAIRIPMEYLMVQAPTVNKTAIMANYKATGEIVPGVEIVRNETFDLK